MHVKDGVALKVTGFGRTCPTAGVLCTKVARYTERTYHPDRLLHPLRRIGKKGEGRFERISWEEAIATIATRLAAVAAEDPAADPALQLRRNHGTGAGRIDVQRFFHRLGASLLDRTICASAGTAGHEITLGSRIGVDVELADQAKLIIFWGCNAITSSVHFWARAQQAKRLGATLVAIDPYRSLTAEKCHTPHRLAAGNRCGARARPHARADSRRSHRSRLREPPHAGLRRSCANAPSCYDPARVASICGITAAEIESLAHLYATTRPALIRANYGLQRVRGGGMAMRNIACLPALIGAFRDAAGGILLSTSGNFTIDNQALSRPDLLAGRTPRTINMSTIGRALNDTTAHQSARSSSTTRIRWQWRRIRRGWRAVSRARICSRWCSSTSRPIPPTMRTSCCRRPRSSSTSMWSSPTATTTWWPTIRRSGPLGEAKPNTEIFRLLARAMGFTEPCFDDSDEAIAQSAVADDWDFNAVRARGWKRIGAARGVARFAEGGFDTPSGKVEFYSQRGRNRSDSIRCRTTSRRWRTRAASSRAVFRSR